MSDLDESDSELYHEDSDEEYSYKKNKDAIIKPVALCGLAVAALQASVDGKNLPRKNDASQHYFAL